MRARRMGAHAVLCVHPYLLKIVTIFAVQLRTASSLQSQFCRCSHELGTVLNGIAIAPLLPMYARYG